jgi:hypothetical protein
MRSLTHLGRAAAAGADQRVLLHRGRSKVRQALESYVGRA